MIENNRKFFSGLGLMILFVIVLVIFFSRSSEVITASITWITSTTPYPRDLPTTSRSSRRKVKRSRAIP